MRCYFMKGGHIAAVELLDENISDAEAIKRGSALFTQRAKEGFEGFEIWARDRVVARFPELDRPSGDQGSKDGKAGKSSSPKGKHNAPVPRPSGMSGAAWSPALSR